eukprot:gene11043-23083_t
MGDELDTGFLDEEKFIVSNDDDELCELDDTASNDKEVDSEEKSIKKKRKFNDLKTRISEKKRQTEETNIQLDLSPEMQLHHLTQYLPEGNMTTSTLQSSMFFNPNPPNELKRPCRFVQAIAAGIHGFRASLKYVPNEKGCPAVVIVCAGASRAVDVIKSVSGTLKCKVAKLFAKHLKIQDQVEALKKHHPIVVGTPNRLHRLIELGALSFSQTKIILIDMENDVKNLNIFTMNDVKNDFFELLNHDIVPELTHIKMALIREKI